MAAVGQPGAMRRITVHYANSPVRGTNRESSDGLDDGLLEFVIGDLQDQESLYQSILGARSAGPSGNPHYCQYHGESSSGTAANSWSSDEQIASDLEYARQLQEEMDDLTIETPPNDEQDDTSCVASPSDADDDDANAADDEAARQDEGDNDNEDPDNMTYEEGQALVESVGSESRGLSDQVIAYLKRSKYKEYKSGFFSRKTNHEDCTICLSSFRHGDMLITLPCKHYYHASCITTWLKIDKTCPVCKYEVFGPS